MQWSGGRFTDPKKASGRRRSWHWPDLETAPLTTATSIGPVEENFDISALPDNAMEEITQGINTRVRLNSVVETGIPGFIPRGK
jgi:hypothetical protein